MNTRAATNINVVDHGTLFVTEDSVPVTNHQLLGGTTTDVLLRLKFHADGEMIDLKKIAFDGVPSSIDSLLLFAVPSGQVGDPTSLQPIAQASNGQCPSSPATRFCALLPLSTLIIQPNHDTTLLVVARAKTDQLGAVSGQIAMISVSGATGDDHAVEARGVSSQQELNQNDGNGVAAGEIIIGQTSPIANTQITSKAHDISLAKISSITNEGQATVPYIPTGNATIGQFRISASPHSNSYGGSNDVVLKTLVFHVTAQNVQLDPAGFALATKDNPSIRISCTGSATTGSFDVTCPNIDAGTIQSHIGQGNSAVYVLSGNITNPALGGGSSILLAELATLGTRAQTNSIVWSDQATTFTWVDVPYTSVQGTTYRQ